MCLLNLAILAISHFIISKISTRNVINSNSVLILNNVISVKNR